MSKTYLIVEIDNKNTDSNNAVNELINTVGISKYRVVKEPVRPK